MRLEIKTVHTILNGKRFWCYIKSLRKDPSGFALLKDNGRLFSSPKDRANLLNHQFLSVYTRENPSSTTPEPDGFPLPGMYNITVTEQGVKKQTTESYWTLHDTSPNINRMLRGASPYPFRRL